MMIQITETISCLGATLVVPRDVDSASCEPSPQPGAPLRELASAAEDRYTVKDIVGNLERPGPVCLLLIGVVVL